MRFRTVLLAASCAVLFHHEVAAQSALDMLALDNLCREPAAPGLRERYKPPVTDADKNKCHAYEKARDVCESLVVYQMFGLAGSPYRSHAHCMEVQYRKHLPGAAAKRKAEEDGKAAKDKAEKDADERLLRSIDGTYAFRYAVEGKRGDEIHAGRVQIRTAGAACGGNGGRVTCPQAGTISLQWGANRHDGPVSVVARRHETGKGFSFTTVAARPPGDVRGKSRIFSFDCKFGARGEITCETGGRPKPKFALQKAA